MSSIITNTTSVRTKRTHQIKALGGCGKATCTVAIIVVVLTMLCVPWMPLSPSSIEGLRKFFSSKELQDGAFRIKAEIALTWCLVYLLLMRKVFSQFSKGKVLCVSVAKYVKWIGGFGLASLLVNQIVMSGDAKASERLEAMACSEILEGLFLLAVGLALERALEIQSETELTI